jgi:hypothetical protein
MDDAAKRFWTYQFANSRLTTNASHLVEHEGWSIWNGTEKIPSPTTAALYHAIQDPITQQYWVRKKVLSRTALAAIDWKVGEAHMKSLALSRRLWVVKNASDQCAVGVTMLKWRKQTDDECCRCGQPETTLHVAKCRGAGASVVFLASMLTLEELLINLGTMPEIQRVLLLRLRQWRNDLPSLTHLLSRRNT